MEKLFPSLTSVNVRKFDWDLSESLKIMRNASSNLSSDATHRTVLNPSQHDILTSRAIRNVKNPELEKEGGTSKGRISVAIGL
jgi:hypothetical protein